MTARPRFAKAPVEQVALAVYFSPPLGLQSVDVGRLWERLSERFPTYGDAPVLPQVPVEVRDASAFSINFQLGPTAGTRTMFQTPAGDRMVQIQGDRVVLNWQRTVDAPDYPGYDVLRPEMIELLQHLRAMCAAVGGGQPQASQVEVHYVNPVPRGGEGPEHASGLLAPWGGETSTGFLPVEEEVRLDVRYPITDGTGRFMGRLYVNAGPAVAAAPGQGPQPVHLLQMFARVLSASSDT
ncbi:MAG: TIGR04255 family protein, partial [Actinomycetota bacterium]|nr:TIGR04255 family protein [Actinomycetota bacterium]